MARTRTLPYVDPPEPRGRLYLAVARLSATKAGAWFSINLAADYRERAAHAGRTIPIFQLAPRDG